MESDIKRQHSLALCLWPSASYPTNLSITALCRHMMWWTIETIGEGELGKSMLVTWGWWYIYISITVRMFTNGLRDWGSILGRVIPKTQKNGTWCLLA